MQVEKYAVKTTYISLTGNAVLAIVKGLAGYFGNSYALVADAIESTSDIFSSFLVLLGIRYASRPADKNHPYGHGKAEFLSAAVEGTLIIIAGVVIIYEAVLNLLRPRPLQSLDQAIILIAITAVINYTVGRISVKNGTKNNSLALIASGQHLKTDAYSTLALIGGLFLIMLTGYRWLDGVVAILFAFFIIYTGYRIMRTSIAGIMDEADMELLEKLVDLLEKNRRDNWVDLHNLRVIKYGNVLHVDCHLTVPWYLNVHEAHEEIDHLGGLIRKDFGESLELFVHSDGCLYFQCHICSKEDCPVRQHAFKEPVVWQLDNILQNKKHGLEDAEKQVNSL